MASPKPLRSALKHHDTLHSPAFTRIPLPPSPSLPPSSLPSTPPPNNVVPATPIFNRTASSPPPELQLPSPLSATTTTASGARYASPPPPTHIPGSGGTTPLHSAMHVRHTSTSSPSSPSPSNRTPNTATTIGPTPYTPKVSFDTFENPLASMFSFTLQVKSAGYRRTHHTRVYLCAASPDESGEEALDWCLESLVQDGDEVIVFRGVDEEVLEKDHDILRENARELMKSIQTKLGETDSERKLSLILEYIPGRVTDTIDRLIALYRPDSLVVGTRGKRGIMAMGMVGMGLGGIGSVSKYCLSHSPVPVIVVRPERQLKKAVEKRKADPKRGTHFD